MLKASNNNALDAARRQKSSTAAAMALLIFAFQYNRRALRRLEYLFLVKDLTTDWFYVRFLNENGVDSGMHGLIEYTCRGNCHDLTVRFHCLGEAARVRYRPFVHLVGTFSLRGEDHQHSQVTAVPCGLFQMPDVLMFNALIEALQRMRRGALLRRLDYAEVAEAAEEVDALILWLWFV